jgi:hypothetical protein
MKTLHAIGRSGANEPAYKYLQTTDANRLKNPDFADGLSSWAHSIGVRVVTDSGHPDRHMVELRPDPDKDAWISQAVDNVPAGVYVVAFGYINNTPLTRDLEIMIDGQTRIAAAFTEEGESQVLYYWFDLLILQAAKSIEFKLRVPPGEKDRPLFLSELLLIRSATSSLVSNGDFEGDAGAWHLSENAEIVAKVLEPEQHYLQLQGAAEQDAFAEQKVALREAGLYSLTFDLDNVWSDPLPPREGAVSLGKQSLGFWLATPEEHKMSFLFEVSEDEANRTQTLRMAKLRNDGLVLEYWRIDNVKLSRLAI